MKKKFDIVILIVAALAFSASWAGASVILQFNNNPNNIVGGSPETIQAAPAASIVISLQLVSTTETVWNLDYWLTQFSGPGSGAFSITGRDFTGSDFNRPTRGNNYVLSAGDVYSNSHLSGNNPPQPDGVPDNLLAPQNGPTLGALYTLLPNPPGTHQVATFTLRISLSAVPGSYQIQTFDYTGFVGFGWGDLVNGVGQDHNFDAQAAIKVQVVPEPSSLLLCICGCVVTFVATARRISRPWLRSLRVVCVALIAIVPSVEAQVYETVFSSTPTDQGISPTELVEASDGNFYGTTSYGGSPGNHGTVFKMTPAGELSTLIVFTGNGNSNKGSEPYAGLVQGSDGSLYGTTQQGGAQDRGTVFKMTPAGVLTTLVEFTGNGLSNKGSYPDTRLVRGSDGAFYGTTYAGGVNDYGTIFKMTPGGVLTTLVLFDYHRGAGPSGTLVKGKNGNFYGTTVGGGTHGVGTVFYVTPAGVLHTLVSFTGNGNNRGKYPQSDLVQDGDGSFYGTTSFGGLNDLGTVFQITRDGALHTLVDFTGNGGSNRGAHPSGGLVPGSHGDFGAQKRKRFYGTTGSGGVNDAGTVFYITPDPAGELHTLVDFTGNGLTNRGANPFLGLLRGSDANFYGATASGGVNYYGTVFKMTRAGVLTTLAEF